MVRLLSRGGGLVYDLRDPVRILFRLGVRGGVVPNTPMTMGGRVRGRGEDTSSSLTNDH